MRIEKFVHSCLLLTVDDQRLLFDPGKFSFVDGRVKSADLTPVDYIVFTHTHPDHLDVDALKAICRNAGPRIFGNSEVVAKLERHGLCADLLFEGELELGPFRLMALSVRHEPILADEIPEVTAVVVNDRFLNPADSFDERLHEFAGIEVLALPVMAPFLTEIAAYEFAKAMKPGGVIPVHDGYARDYFLKQRYDTFEPYLEKAGIVLHRLSARGEDIQL